MSEQKKNRAPGLGPVSPEAAETVVFLDIDGVLQPASARIHVADDRRALDYFYKGLKKSFKTDYTVYSDMDVMTVYYLWEKESVANLKKILDASGAFLVLSSSWRIYPMEQMRDLFRIHGLDKYYIDNTMLEDFRVIGQLREDVEEYKGIHADRVIEILEYLKRHPNIKNYVAIDDMDLLPGLEGHFVRTSQSLTGRQAEQAIKILRGAAGR
jgi:L-rhamnose mutarotase